MGLRHVVEVYSSPGLRFDCGMIERISRRLSLKLFSFSALIGLLGNRAVKAQSETPKMDRLDRWDRTHDRVWIGGDFWANPMEDWRIRDGWAECGVDAADRSLHSLTHQITNPDGRFVMSVNVGRRQSVKKDGGAGFRIGVKSDLNEVKSNVFAGKGVDAGLVGDQLFIGRKTEPLAIPVTDEVVVLELSGVGDESDVSLTLIARSSDGTEVLGKLKARVKAEEVIGNVALVSQYKGGSKRIRGTGGYRFLEWQAGGDAFSINPEQAFGPILWSMYSLSDSRSEEGFIMKLSALLGPMGTSDQQEVDLEIMRDEAWQAVGSESMDPAAWVATWRVPNWDEKVDTPFRLTYRERLTDGSEVPMVWAGRIRQNPVGRPVRVGGLTCQKDYAFPYEPVAKNLVNLDPDLLFFSGDQLYENHGGYGIIRDEEGPAILNYLRKFYMHGWAFGDAMRDRPTICVTDDHDVFHGNIWGEGGEAFDTETPGNSKAGYKQPPGMVNVVHTTHASHHPDFYDPTPMKRDISVYYGDMVYGGVSFAILGDRQWKSGPERVDTGTGRADHVYDPEWDTQALDADGLELLGERQEAFLDAWGDDWRGHTMKVLLSQTLFVNAATHHGKFDGYTKADLDSGGWPQTARNRAVELLRKSKALHINGDQHLSTMTQYGVNQQRDANWSFCTPAIAAGYPRWWRPDEIESMPHENRPSHGLPNTGEYFDGFGNPVYVYAVGNPEVGTEEHRYDLAHQKASGFGLVTIDTEKKTYLCECFRFLIDATDGNPENQFPGWPVVIQMEENGGENQLEA
ncbi:MAG: alkaline phosphatase D family protein [Verrucomicrobiota bacterium]